LEEYSTEPHANAPSPRDIWKEAHVRRIHLVSSSISDRCGHWRHASYKDKLVHRDHFDTELSQQWVLRSGRKGATLNARRTVSVLVVLGSWKHRLPFVIEEHLFSGNSGHELHQ
ncbi:hypothetical protein T12_10278, partial [Trichinella patagoniensis]